MSEERVYYKVVFKDILGKLYSATIVSKLLCVEYKVGEWVRGRYPLFIFDDYHLAMEFGMNTEEVFECHAKNVRKIEGLIPNAVIADTDEIKQYWEDGVDELLFGGLLTSPLEGTLIADEVMLIKEVE